MTELPPLIVAQTSVSPLDERALLDSPLGEGVDGFTDLRVTTGGSGLLLNVAAGVGFVRGDSIPDQGLYRCRNDAAKSSADFTLGGITPAHGTNPRIDSIIARVYDHEADASGQRKWQLEVLTGTPTGGATLDNKLGAVAIPASALLLADILVPAAFAGPFVDATHIRDRRAFAYPIVPPLLTTVDAVPLIPLGLAADDGVSISNSHDLRQAAALFNVPRRIVSATRIRWRYFQGSGGTALTGQYVLALYAASGRKIAETAATSFTGAALSVQERSETIPATTFEAGPHYLFIGVDTTNSGAIDFQGIEPRFPPMDNIALGAASGGLTAPATLLNLTDPAPTSEAPPVPVACLSVG